jgi:hypothetical protein
MASSGKLRTLWDCSSHVKSKHTSEKPKMLNSTQKVYSQKLGLESISKLTGPWSKLEEAQSDFVWSHVPLCNTT